VGLKLNKAKQYLISGFVDSSLNLTQEEEQTFRQELEKLQPEEREKTMEITTSWMREGVKIGKQQGLEEGRYQEALKLTLRMLRKRLRAIPTETRKRIETLSLGQLEKLSDALFTFSEIADLNRWLDKNLSKSN